MRYEESNMLKIDKYVLVKKTNFISNSNISLIVRPIKNGNFFAIFRQKRNEKMIAILAHSRSFFCTRWLLFFVYLCHPSYSLWKTQWVIDAISSAFSLFFLCLSLKEWRIEELVLFAFYSIRSVFICLSIAVSFLFVRPCVYFLSTECMSSAREGGFYYSFLVFFLRRIFRRVLSLFLLIFFLFSSTGFNVICRIPSI